MDKNEIMDVFNRMNEFQKKRTLCYYPLRRDEFKEDKENLIKDFMAVQECLKENGVIDNTFTETEIEDALIRNSVVFSYLKKKAELLNIETEKEI